MKRRLATCLAMSLGSTCISSTCFAAPDGEATLLVQYDDLDLSTPQGLKTLHRRIERAADRVCLAAAGAAPGEQVDLGCRADALAAARRHLPQAIAEQRQSKSPAVAQTAPR
jgi:UrcA family protein